MKKQLRLVLKVVILLLMPTITFAQAPPLGSAADFVLFTSVGAVSNVGTYKYMTHLTGNVGTNSGSSTNFGNVNGAMHDGDGTSIQCAADLLVAYNSLSAAIPTTTLGPLIGNGFVYTAGVYIMSGATTLQSDLILNAEGNPNAVFIFKTPTDVAYAFTANPDAKIKLINGAQACNVFWQVSGAVLFNTGVSMKGTIIAGGAIIMSAQDTLEGRALTINGAITVSNGALGFLAYTPIGCGSPVLTGPVAPAFAGLSSYAIFATIGAVSDCGTSHVTGDVGGHTVAPTGFNPLFVSGAIHFNDPSTTAAASDLTVIYNNLLALPYDIKLLDPAGFGHNLVLTPHTYQMDAAVSFTDTVYLDAQGNPDAVFIIKTFGAFASTPGSKVILMNGTQAKNVYWFVTGAVSITANSIFMGTIVAHGAIDILNGSVLNGRAFSTNGAIATCGMTASPTFVTATGPFGQTACVGGSATFTVAISSPAPTYQWRKGLVSLIEGGNLSGTTTSILTINPVALSDAALNYNVVIAGSVTPAITSANASLTVNPLPVPTIAGPASVAVNSVGNVYSTAAGMTGYTWTVSSGGTITGGSATNTITVTWNTAGAQNVSVNYLNLNNCTATSPSVYSVTVNPLLIPTIAGPSSACIATTGIVYTTQAGKTGYAWTITAGGTITSGAGSNSITVSWNTAGAQSLGVTYTSATTVSYPVTVNPAATPFIGSNNTPCTGSANNIYYTNTGQSNYNWTVSAGSIVSGQGTSSINVTWTGVGAQFVTVNFANSFGCSAAAATVYNVFLLPSAGAANPVNGVSTLCAGTNGVAYSTLPVANATSYSWTVPAGATISTGAGTTNITVNFGPGAISGAISVSATNSCGNGTASPNFNVEVNAIPETPVISANGSVLTSNAPSGNQWYYEGTLIQGATSQSYPVINNSGYYWSTTTLNDCSSSISNKILINVVGVPEVSNSTSFTIHPIPSDGKFTASIDSPADDIYTIMVYNELGEKLLELRDVETVQGKFNAQIDLRPVPDGMCLVVFMNSEYKIVRKVIIRK